MAEVNEKVKKVIRVLGTATMDRKGIMGCMDLKGRRSFLQYHLTPAMKQGYVRFLYPESPNCPIQEYQLTEKGLNFLEELKKEEGNKQGTSKEQVGNK